MTFVIINFKVDHTKSKCLQNSILLTSYIKNTSGYFGTQCFVVWQTMSCFADRSICRHMTFIIIEWSTHHGQPCIITMTHGHVTVIRSVWIFRWHMILIHVSPLTQKTICNFKLVVSHTIWPSVIWRCWLGIRKGIRPVKNWVVPGATATHCLLLQ